jgi:dTDP-4-dehydrorhamnose 3,5-epimerase
MDFIEPIKFPGERYLDSRGELLFNNQAMLAEFKRMYLIANAPGAPFRGWHGHKFEAKGFVCIEGAIRIGGVRIDDWANPSPGLRVFSENLVAGSMDFVYLPAGYANAIMSLESGSRVLVFSSSTLDESQEDDYRYDPGLWSL